MFPEQHKSHPINQKFMQHFESIKTPVKSSFASEISGTNSNKSMRDKYNKKMEEYKSDKSVISEIINGEVNNSSLSKSNFTNDLDFVEKPMLITLDSNIKNRIERINEFFNPTHQETANAHHSDKVNLEGYLFKLLNIPLVEYKRHSEKSRSKSRSRQSIHSANRPKQMKSTPPKYRGSNANLEVVKDSPQESSKLPQDNLNNSPELVTERTAPRLKKIDLLLMQIFHEKKRRGVVEDYYRVTQMKLAQLLEFILQDEIDYYGLSLKDKMKKVLKNLQSFKGKTVEGESKVSLLRIFFEEFRNLKRQKEEEDEEREKETSKHYTVNAKHNESVGPSQKSKNKNIIPSPNKLMKSSKKASDTFSLGGRPLGSKNKNNKGQQEEDEWMGSLQ